jgi:arylsulfatase A-like enzyme
MNRRDFLKSTGAALAAPAFGAARRPNILFFFPDQHRYDWTGVNRNIPVRTPNFDALAARGTRFTRAVTAAPVCAPARACLASGREYDRCNVPSNAQDLPLDQTTYFRLLRQNGYDVMGCGKFDLSKGSHFQGVDGKLHMKEWGFTDGVNNAGKHDAMGGATEPKDPYMAYLHRRGLAAAHVADFGRRKGYDAVFPTPLDEEAYCDNWLSKNGLDLLRTVPQGKPWHLWINFTGPHPPMDVTARMEKTVRGRDFPQPNRSTEYDAKTHIAIRQNYSAMIENIDRWMGVFLDEVKRRGELDRPPTIASEACMAKPRL